MQVISELIEIENLGNFSTEFVENTLIKKKINPLRWAIVDISEEMISINVSYEVVGN